MLNQWDRRSLICWRLDLDIRGHPEVTRRDLIQGSNVAHWQHPMAMVSRGQSLVVTAPPRFAPNYAASIQAGAAGPGDGRATMASAPLQHSFINYTKHARCWKWRLEEMHRLGFSAEHRLSCRNWNRYGLRRWTAWWRNGMPRLNNVKSMSCTKYTSSEREKLTTYRSSHDICPMTNFIQFISISFWRGCCGLYDTSNVGLGNAPSVGEGYKCVGICAHDR